MKPSPRSLPILLLVAATAVVAACAGKYPEDEHPGSVPVDLLVVPASDSGVPPQVHRNLTWDDVSDGAYDLELAGGSAFTAHVLSTSGEPLANAAVRITLQGAGIDTVAYSDEWGTVSVKLGRGTYDVEVTPDRTISAYQAIPPRIFRDVGVPLGGAPIEMDLVMPEGILIRGQVLGSNNENLTGYRVSARLVEGSDPSTWAETGLAGFAIYVSSTGDWLVQATPPDGSEKPVGKKKVSVSGEILGFTFQYPSVQNYFLSGVVGPAGGGPIPEDFIGISVRARAQIASADPDVTFSFDQKTYTDAAGVFSMEVPAGTYSLTIEPGLDLEYSHRVESGLEVFANTEVLSTLTQLFPQVSVSGRVLGENGDGAGGTRLRLIATDGSAYQYSGRAGDDGRYDFKMDLGKYSVDVLPVPGSGLVRQSTSLEIDRNEVLDDFVLDQGHLVRGKLLVPDPVGEGLIALADASLVVLDRETGSPIGSADAVSDASGRWTLTVPLRSASE